MTDKFYRVDNDIDGKGGQSDIDISCHHSEDWKS